MAGGNRGRGGTGTGGRGSGKRDGDRSGRDNSFSASNSTPGRGRGSAPGRGRGDGGGRGGGTPQGRGMRTPGSQPRSAGPQGSFGSPFPRSQSVGTPPSAGRGGPGGPTFSASYHNRNNKLPNSPHLFKRHGGPPFQDASGQVNPFLFVELERSNVWKVSIPAGQTFGKQFLAGLESWANLMVTTYQGGGSAAGADAGGVNPPPPPPPLASRLHESNPPPPPPQPGQASVNEGALDWASFLSGAPAPDSAASTAANRTVSAPARPTTSDNYYRPVLEGDAEAVTLTPEQQQMLSGGFFAGAASMDSSGSSSSMLGGSQGVVHVMEQLVEGDEEAGGQQTADDGMDEGEAVEGEAVEVERLEYGGSEYDDDDEEEDEQEQEEGGTDGSEIGSYDYAEMLEDDIKQEEEDGQLYDAMYPEGSFSSSQESDAQQQGAGTSSPPGQQAGNRRERRGQGSILPSSKGQAVGGKARVRVSLRLEKHALTDAELQLFTRWYQERGSQMLELTKLWLFDNRLGDEGAACVATLMHPGLLEVHLSHNAITTAGAQLLLANMPLNRTPAQGRPLWLRMEWNLINQEALLDFARAEKLRRGLKIEVPKAVVTEGQRGHEQNLKFKQSPHAIPSSSSADAAHVCMPWIQCQKQAPSEAAILQDVKAIYRSAPAVPPPAKPTAPISTLPVPPPPPRTSAARPAQASTATSLPGLADTTAWPPGPLLLFPDTSALMSMLGANNDLPKSSISLDALTQLAGQGRFGRQGLDPEHQVFLVVADSVMKQLDGLKALPGARAAIRSFLSDGLEQCGPAGLDFLTVLGAHEGEGLAMSVGALGAAGSRSPFVLNKGQAVDYRIVEVALFFQAEVLKAAGGGSAGGDGASGAGPMPVILLSNDNAQLSAARAHGLPAFRLSSEGPEVAATMRKLLDARDSQSAPALTSGVLRSLLGPSACAGLGSAAPMVPLQESFDDAVSAVHATTSALASVQSALSVITDTVHAAQKGKVPLEEALEAITRLLSGSQQQPAPSSSGAGSDKQVAEPAGPEAGSSPVKGAPLVAAIQGLVTSLQEPLAEWDARCKTHQQPSRLLKWALPS